MTGSEEGPERVCLRKARRTEMIMPVSMVSRKTMKKTGTAKTLGAIVAAGSLGGERVGEGLGGLGGRDARERWEEGGLWEEWTWGVRGKKGNEREGEVRVRVVEIVLGYYPGV
jgi:hypothetical protein